jgi:hypothetical protein
MTGQENGMKDRGRRQGSARQPNCERRMNWLLPARWSSNSGVRYAACVLILLLPLIYIIQDGSLPITIRQQNILTYPTLNIAQCPSLMTKMDVNEGAMVEIWNPHIKQWRPEEVDHSMNIKGKPELLIRLLGITDCPGHAQLIGEGPAHSTVEKGKRRLEIDSDGEESRISQARHAKASTWLPSPSSSNLSLAVPSYRSFSVTSSPLSSMPSSPAFSHLSLPTMTDYGHEMFSRMTVSPSPSPGLSLMPTSIDTYDSLWKLGHVHVPENNSPWPAGMYARDMAWGFTHMRESRGDVETRFRQVFPGAPWVKATYYRHRDAFFRSTSSEIEACRSLCQSAGGLWTDWKAGSSGWKLVAARKKKGSNRCHTYTFAFTWTWVNL